MASSSSKRKLGLEEARGEGKVGKRVLSEDAAKLYVFVAHGDDIDYVYSLYALDIPSEDTVGTVETKTALNLRLKGNKFPISSIIEPRRSPVTPVLRFRWQEGWPNDMKCIGLDRKLYFLGGRMVYFLGGRMGGRIGGLGANSKQLHVLDLSTKEMVDDPRKALKPLASMRTGKSPLFVSFVADGQIFVVCGEKQCPFTGEPFTRFEIFSPSKGVWHVPDLQPPFPHAYYLYTPIVIYPTVFFAGQIDRGETFTCLYNIHTCSWTDYCVQEHFTPAVREIMELGGEAGGLTLWNVCDHPTTHMPVVVRFDLAHLMGGSKPKNNKFFKDILRNCIPDQVDDGFGLCPPAHRLVTRVAAGHSSSSSRLLFLQLERGPFHGLVDGETRISATVFDVHGKGAGSARYITSAHYFIPHYKNGCRCYTLTGAHLV